jgi:hypothetical protein
LRLQLSFFFFYFIKRDIIDTARLFPPVACQPVVRGLVIPLDLEQHVRVSMVMLHGDAHRESGAAGDLSEKGIFTRSD